MEFSQNCDVSQINDNFDALNLSRILAQERVFLNELTTDHTFPTDIQQSHQSSFRLDEKVAALLRKTRILVSESEKQKKITLNCSNHERDQLVGIFQNQFEMVGESLELLGRTLNHEKLGEIHELKVLKQSLLQTKSIKEWAESVSTKYQTKAKELNHMTEIIVQKLKKRLDKIFATKEIEQNQKELLIEFAESQQEHFVEQIKRMKHYNQESLEELLEKIKDANSDFHEYAIIFNLKLQKIAELLTAELEFKDFKRRAAALSANNISYSTRQDDCKSNLEDDSDEEDVNFKQCYKSKRTQKPAILSIQTSQTTFIATPAKFGLPIWNEIDMSFLEHMMVCDRGMQYANDKNLSLGEQQNLLLQTLPLNYHYVGAFIEENDKTSMEKFKRKLMELIIGSNWDQISSILNASRKTGEKILRYYLRLMASYKFCTNKSDQELLEDHWCSMMIYQKIFEALPLGAKVEFQRDCEMSMENGLLKSQNLRKMIVKIARKSPIIEQQLSQQVIHVLEGRNSNDGSENDVEEVSSIVRSAGRRTENGGSHCYPGEEQRSCYFCGEIGHKAKECWKRYEMNARHNFNN